MSEWQTTETAPKDGQHVLIATAEDVVLEAYYESDGDRGWYESGSHWTDQYDGSVHQVVAWQPLPPPPSEAISASLTTKKSPRIKPLTEEREKHLLFVISVWKERALAAQRELRSASRPINRKRAAAAQPTQSTE